MPRVGGALLLRREPSAIQEETDPIGLTQFVELWDQVGAGARRGVGLTGPIQNNEVDDITAGAGTREMEEAHRVASARSGHGRRGPPRTQQRERLKPGERERRFSSPGPVIA